MSAGLLLLVNGPCGVGKTSLGQELVETLDASVFLDGDALDYLNPFALAGDRQWRHLLGSLRALIEHHAAVGYRHCVIAHVFLPGQAEELASALSWPPERVTRLRLTARPDALGQRITRRASPDMTWELVRAAELEPLLTAASDAEEIVLDTSDHGPGETLLAAKAALFKLWRRSVWMANDPRP